MQDVATLTEKAMRLHEGLFLEARELLSAMYTFAKEQQGGVLKSGIRHCWGWERRASGVQRCVG